MEDVVLPVLPMFHVNAWRLPYAVPMTGAKRVLCQTRSKFYRRQLRKRFRGFDSPRTRPIRSLPSAYMAVLPVCRAADSKLR